MCEQRVVGISDRSVSAAPDEIVTFALGSCVGVALYDEAARIGGLAHIMLPDSSLRVSHGSRKPALSAADRMKFADTGVEDMVAEMSSRGASVGRMKAKIAGGANMFGISDSSALGSIGGRNVHSVRAALGRLGIPIVAEDVGSDFGRTMFLDLATGKVRVKSFVREVNEI
ncbi:MAG: chemotaxis protein CheD [Clostridiales Family XIII bacterium]|jgi:chemotaxis protein CheD|nr:chemotaxis protein CheD [Clostridiales Family XIII bacterium]